VVVGVAIIEITYNILFLHLCCYFRNISVLWNHLFLWVWKFASI